MQFNTDEKLLINSMGRAVKLSSFTKENVLETLAFVRSAVNDPALLGMMNALRAKVLQMPEEDWRELRETLPFRLPWCPEDMEPWEGDD